MRSLSLVRIAAQAETFRLRHLVRRQVTRAVCGVVAAVFLIGVLVSVHVAGALALTWYVSPIVASLIVAGIDLLIAVVLGVIAARDVPSKVEQEALLVRRHAVDEAVEAVMLATLLRRLVRVRSWGDLAGVAGALAAAWMVSMRR